MSSPARRARAALTALVEPGDALLNELLDQWGAEEVLTAVRAGRGGAIPADELPARAVARWRARLDVLDVDRDIAAGEHVGGRLICPGDPEWPTQLDDLADARPYALWARGDGDLRFGCLRSVAVVGSRAASGYGTHVTAELAGDLAERGWTPVSGGAYGVDAAAHRAAVLTGGPTIAVLACGIDVAYPAAHQGLFDQITTTGVVVSEWPPGATPFRARFLVRNRVIAALTRGTVVVEAASRSGALNTARHARDLNRVVMAVPGPVTSQMSTGCHWMLREWNAVCVTRVEEVIEQVGGIGTDLAERPGSPVLPRDELDATMLRVLDAVPLRGSGGPAQISVTAGIEMDTTVGCLGRLAAGGFVERVDGGWRVRRE